MDLSNIPREVFSLLPEQRAALACELIRSLDNSDEIDAENLWIEEAEKRLSQILNNKNATRNSTEVLREAKNI